ncbi:hypothetical protein ACQKGO_24190 [Corallococcus interemptor]
MFPAIRKAFTASLAVVSLLSVALTVKTTAETPAGAVVPLTVLTAALAPR